MERQSVPAKNWEPGGIDDLTLPPITEDIASTSSISGSGKSSPRADHTKGPVRVDMQMGRCRWIRVYDNVTYIVAGIVIRNSSTNGDFEVLLIQEAKQKCRGKWYMPAGHVEPGETIDEACRREMLEETGFECQVESLICMEVRGSGWFRMAFTCQIIGGTIKTTADDESLASGWFSLASIRDRSSGLQLRCRDFMNILDAAVYFEEWKKSIPQQLVESGKQRWKPIINRDEAQPGLFIEFVIIKTSTLTEKVDCLVHRSMTDELQLLDNQLVIEAFPCVEFGFEYFFPLVVSKCYRHILEDGHAMLEMPEAVIGMWCLPAPVSSTRQGIRLRILCRQKRSGQKAVIRTPNRYHWISLENEEVLESLYLLPDQFRPKLLLL